MSVCRFCGEDLKDFICPVCGHNERENPGPPEPVDKALWAAAEEIEHLRRERDLYKLLFRFYLTASLNTIYCKYNLTPVAQLVEQRPEKA